MHAVMNKMIVRNQNTKNSWCTDKIPLLYIGRAQRPEKLLILRSIMYID